jgi:predicted metalloprotease with PDZ domain
MDDTWDTEIKEDFIFEPGGTNIEAGKNFVINPFGFFGYFEGYKRAPFELKFLKPRGFYGSTALKAVASDVFSETYRLDSYMDLADSPIMFCLPDTTTQIVGGAEVLVSVYSPNKMVSSKFVSKTIADILRAIEKFLGGKLPVERYAFLIYLTDQPTLSNAHGALEHSFSSFYVLPEAAEQDLESTFRDISAHEFFHIVTPLTIHSEQIHDFDYNTPDMSQHLWFYEGLTEYVSHYCQVQAGLTTPEDFLKTMREKMVNATTQYNDTVPFTRMSKLCLTTYKDQYGNVYEKGALIAMTLDVLIRDLSDGKSGIQQLIFNLQKKYGRYKPFKDDDFFAEITALTYPEVGVFLNKHVGGPEPLPLKDILGRIGIRYIKDGKEKRLTLGGFKLGVNMDKMLLTVEDASEVDAFGRAIGFKKGDLLSKLNGQELKLDRLEEVIGNWYRTTKEGDLVKFELLRPKGKKAKRFKKIKASAKAIKVDIEVSHLLSPDPDMNDTQKRKLKAWLSGKSE